MEAHRLDEISTLTVTLAASDDRRALLLTTFDIVHNAIILSLRNLRTLIGVRLKRVAIQKSVSLSDGAEVRTRL